MAVIFEPGEYYIGDLCYVLDDLQWKRLLNKSGYLGYDLGSNQWVGTFGKYKIFAGSTAYGDGIYHDQEEYNYGVDSGTIGIIETDWLEVSQKSNKDLGRIVTFKHPFEVSLHEGVFRFGHIVIDTKGEEEDDV